MAKKFLRIVIVFAACSLVVNSIRTPPLKATVNDADKKNADVEQAQIHHHHKVKKEITKKGGVEMEMYPTGSSLPDCSYACGPCSPCKRVMISFQCSVAESCSVIYRCTCRGRYYHVPSRA
ncbi:protein EPIDERMAL PATTERNING FACTOR 2 [Capsella rubella]|uniref:protein EPIDERMAL PATTERNING FACTOR 2 n=1 Tax=Capsella rubella TaxID=81985 RepID=UPI000CD4BB10|nr:protein EPIDERMAL PATTERNING FACTOR 2 [Capsella rubella]